MNSEDFDDITSRVLDGEVSAEEFAELECHLEESPEARARFVEHVDLHNILGQRFSVPAFDPLASCDVVPTDLVRKCPTRRLPRRVPRSMDLVRERHKRQKRRSLQRSFLAVFAVLALAGVLFKTVQVTEPKPQLSFRASDDSILSVTHHAANGEEPAPGTLAKGSRLVLSQGAVELTLASGVTGLVQAPADLTLQEEDLIYQKSGVARFRVPKDAVGFQVQTSDILVTDLGTEFGVISTPGESDEVHLLEGKVEALNQHGLQNTELLTGRVARVADPAGQLQPVALRPERFLDSLPAKIPQLHVSFDSMEGDKIDVQGDYPDVSAWLKRGDAPSDIPPLVKGRFGKALRLNGAGDYVQTDWPGISGQAARTVAMWIRLPDSGRNRHSQGILAWGNTHISGGKFEINWNSLSRCGPLGALRFDCGEGYVVGTRDLRDGRWHHLAVVFGGEVDPEAHMRVQLYVDGIPEKTGGFLSADPDTILSHAAEELMRIGRYYDTDLRRVGTLEGELDELYIFSGVLAPESIKRLMDTGW